MKTRMTIAAVVASMAVSTLGMVTPASAVTPVAADDAGVTALTKGEVITAMRSSKKICGNRRHKVTAWEVTGAEGFDVASTGGWPLPKKDYLLRVNTVYFLCDYARRKILDKVIPSYNQYCVTLLDSNGTIRLYGVSFDGYMSAARSGGKSLVATYVDTDRLDDRGDTNCVRAGLGYITRRALNAHPAMQVTAEIDQAYQNKSVKINRGDLSGIPLDPKISARVG